MEQGFGRVARKVKRIQRIVYTVLAIMFIIIVASVISVTMSIEDNGGIHNTLVKIVREVKNIDQSKSSKDITDFIIDCDKLKTYK